MKKQRWKESGKRKKEGKKREEKGRKKIREEKESKKSKMHEKVEQSQNTVFFFPLLRGSGRPMITVVLRDGYEHRKLKP